LFKYVTTDLLPCADILLMYIMLCSYHCHAWGRGGITEWGGNFDQKWKFTANFPNLGLRLNFKLLHPSAKFWLQSYPPQLEDQAIWAVQYALEKIFPELELLHSIIVGSSVLWNSHMPIWFSVFFNNLHYWCVFKPQNITTQMYPPSQSC